MAAVRVEGRRVNIGKCAKCRQGEEGEVMDSLPCICVWCNRLMDADRKPLRPATAEERDEWTYRDETTGPEGCGLDGGKAGQGFCAECEAQGVPDPFAMPSVFCVECGHALTMEEYIVYLNECVRDLPSATLACAGCREGRR